MEEMQIYLTGVIFYVYVQIIYVDAEENPMVMGKKWNL